MPEKKNYPTKDDRREKADQTTQAATEILAKEHEARLQKTAHLRALRLAAAANDV